MTSGLGLSRVSGTKANSSRRFEACASLVWRRGREGSHFLHVSSNLVGVQVRRVSDTWTVATLTLPAHGPSLIQPFQPSTPGQPSFVISLVFFSAFLEEGALLESRTPFSFFFLPFYSFTFARAGIYPGILLPLRYIPRLYLLFSTVETLKRKKIAPPSSGSHLRSEHECSLQIDTCSVTVGVSDHRSLDKDGCTIGTIVFNNIAFGSNDPG